VKGLLKLTSMVSGVTAKTMWSLALHERGVLGYGWWTELKDRWFVLLTIKLWIWILFLCCWLVPVWETEDAKRSEENRHHWSCGPFDSNPRLLCCRCRYCSFL